MANPKIETAESVAQKITENMQPGLTFNAAKNVKQPAQPKQAPWPPKPLNPAGMSGQK